MNWYRKKTPLVNASQWFKNGDHPNDGTEVFENGEFKGELLEGKVVRYYRDPSINGKIACSVCGAIMHEHGWIDDGSHGHTVCPGDMIVQHETGGNYYPFNINIFNSTYDHVYSDKR